MAGEMAVGIVCICVSSTTSVDGLFVGRQDGGAILQRERGREKKCLVQPYILGATICNPRVKHLRHLHVDTPTCPATEGDNSIIYAPLASPLARSEKSTLRQMVADFGAAEKNVILAIG